MVVHNTVTVDEVTFDHYVSDRGMLLLQDETQNYYVEAYDPAPSRYTYVESNIPVDPVDPNPTIEEKAAAYDVLMGGADNDDN